METEITKSQNTRVDEFISKHGDLEGVRKRLNLSKREMSNLLWVEPSAWTRWSRGVSRPPDHIYRALGWYLELRENKPEESLSAVPIYQAEEGEEWRDEKLRLQQELERKEALGFGWKLILVICLVISIINLIF